MSATTTGKQPPPGDGGEQRSDPGASGAHRPDPAGERVRPTDEDPVAAAGSELIGGRAGRRIRFARRGDRGFWTPLRVLAVCAVVVFALGIVQKYPCYAGGWFRGANAQYVHACYSDIPHLFQARGFADGLTPYLDRLPASLSPDLHYLEYPVLTGVFMQVAAWLTPGGGGLVHREQVFYMANAALLMVCMVVAVVAVARTHRRRPWDALLLALAPAVLLNGTVNWDLFAVALLAVGMLLWARERPVWAGVLFGLATAAKLYPVLVFGPLLVLALRTWRWRPLLVSLVGGAGAWLAVNLPWMVANPTGWATFYTFSQSRGEDYGSFWLVLMQQRGRPLGIGALDTWEGVLMVAACAAVAVLALAAPRRPRLPQLVFLVVAAFALSNKVYSPQYVVWLVPLAALARPRWRDLLIWQAGEVLYFVGVWLYLAQSVTQGGRGLPEGGYHLVIVVHILCTLYLCAVIVRDMLMPERDPVRLDGSDDPAGGVFDGAPDRFTLGRLRGLGPRGARSGGGEAVAAPPGGGA